jgi:hypothetical protein
MKITKNTLPRILSVSIEFNMIYIKVSPKALFDVISFLKCISIKNGNTVLKIDETHVKAYTEALTKTSDIPYYVFGVFNLEKDWTLEKTKEAIMDSLIRFAKVQDPDNIIDNPHISNKYACDKITELALFVRLVLIKSKKCIHLPK